MSYTYNLSPETCFEDRYSQFIAFGIPKADVDTLRSTIKDMWADAPGGWSYEWSAFARKYLEGGNPLLASFAYGFAIFPCLANDARRKAQQNQLECYLKAPQTASQTSRSRQAVSTKKANNGRLESASAGFRISRFLL
jgi:esterase FrsA